MSLKRLLWTLLLVVSLLSPAALASDPPASKPPKGDSKKPNDDKPKDGGKKRDGQSKKKDGKKRDKKKGKKKRRSDKRKTGKNNAKDDKDAKKTPRNLAAKALRLRIEDAELEDLTLEEFAEWLARTTEANIVVRWGVLEKAGVERDYPLNLSRQNITIKLLLREVFRQVTEDLPNVELAAKADGNTLIISTRAEINAKRFARVYDVQDLLFTVPDFRAMGDHEGSDRSRSGGDRRLRSEAEIIASYPPNVQQLINLIIAHVQPMSWKINGGKGTIVYYKGKLVIYNNIEVHQLIGGVLTENGKKPPKDKKS